MKLNNYKKNIFFCLICLIIGILAVTLKSDYLKDGIIFTLLWAGVSMGWNILGGYAGQLSIGHAAFFGVGAYTSTLLHLHFGLSPWIGMLIGGLVAGVLAGFIGVITLRLRGPFFVLATMAIGEVMRMSVISWRTITEGSLGIFIPLNFGFWNMTWNSKNPYIWLMLIYVLLVYFFCRAIESRKFGYYLVALRENLDSASALGVDTTAMKVLATIISAFIVAIGGSLYAQYTLFVEPMTVFGLMWSIQMALIAIIGGLGTAAGPIIGAALLIPLHTYFRGTLSKYSGLSGLIYGLTLLAVILFMSEGILPRILKILGRRKKILYDKNEKEQ